MLHLCKRAAPVAAVGGGVVWMLLPFLATTAPAFLSAGIIGVVLVAIAVLGVHELYREYRSGFYEEIGVAVLLLGFVTTVIAITTYSPANTDTLIGIILSSLPVVVAAILVSIGSALVGVALLASRAVPVWGAIPMLVAMPVDVGVYYFQLSTFGTGVSVYGVAWCLLGVAMYVSSRSGRLTSD